MTAHLSDPARRETLPHLWATGRCPRDHDITNPDNVAIVRRTDRGHQHLCRICRRERTRARRHNTRLLSPSRDYPDRVCDRCGERYSKPRWDSRVAWARRRYCGSVCAAAALADMRRDLSSTPGARPGPLDEATVARLRAMVGIAPRPEEQR